MNRLMLLRIAFGAGLLLVAATGFGQAVGNAERAALEALFQDRPQGLSYTEQFAQAVSPEVLDSHLKSIRAEVGRYQGVEGNSNPYTVRFEKGTATVHIAVASSGAIAGLQFTQVAKAAASLHEAVQDFLSLHGDTSISIIENGEMIVNEGSDEPLAVGSSFKLAVLRAVEVAVSEGELAWDTVLTLSEDDKSLPTGVMQNWPEGSPVTVDTAAILMISQSDNTATDLLIRTVGRGRVERYARDSMPVLTTREFFLLKSDSQTAARNSFLRSSTQQKREVLDRLEGELPPASLFSGGPVHRQIEWFFTTADLAELIEQIERTDILAVNAGPVEPSEWDEYGYKGGSEPGVVNMTLRLVSEDGDRFAISATQNRANTDVDMSTFVSSLQTILAQLD